MRREGERLPERFLRQVEYDGPQVAVACLAAVFPWKFVGKLLFDMGVERGGGGCCFKPDEAEALAVASSFADLG